ncbi:MAG: hypothetical protein COV72_03385 [Candidatus Omnitrophica bacterium CG11_big_fil_rev_8_21_14_0_20_42_13]|uniref:Uncharacterized protein n=1 Tax=Candidatus Ghiorseimicrobium undicola TaxID=1974746 RepID=A0A2H0LYD2_9BACT|nr:MAG: hypothetical protein COV72_03385 [Candidatus Omnitrophica bacterium CG11_big_fil_rev_8_21_14_0_20_42_13]
MKIFFSNIPKKIEFFARNLKGISAYFILSDSVNIKRIESFLSNIKGLRCIDKNAFLKNYTFKADYIEFIARLNQAQEAFDWNALNLSTKSRLSFDFYYRLFYASIIKGVIDTGGYDNLIVVSDDYALAQQVKMFSRQSGHSFNLALRVSGKRYISMLCFFLPVSVFFVFLRTLFYAFAAKIMLSPRVKREHNGYLIKTLLSHYSFDTNGDFKDIYFHRLVNYFKKKQINFIIDATIFKPYLRNIIKVKRERKNFIIIPREAYLSYLDIIKCFLVSLRRFFGKFDIKSGLLIGNVDLSSLVASEIQKECASKDFFLNLLEYYSMKSFIKNVKFNKVIYPFEHRSWESMLIFAIREARFPSSVIGYQHTSIAPKHTNFILGKNEWKNAILPDRIISMGKITKGIMENYGSFPPEILEAGPALRQEIVAEGVCQKDVSGMRNILVAMTTDTDEYRKMMGFIKEAFSADNYFKVRIRPHPLAYLEGAPKEYNFSSVNFEFDYDKNLVNSLSWADIVFYCSSTVSIEAIQRGIPIVYVDFGEDLCPDPLFELSDFKWRVSKPEKVLDALTRIKQMPIERFNLAKNKARSYACEYIYPSTEDNLAVF